MKDRNQLPQLDDRLFLTDGGIETTLIFQDGFELPHFAAFHLLRQPAGRAALIRYYERFIAIARRDRLGFILESPTWRASPDWGEKLGYTKAAIANVNRDAIALMRRIKTQHEPASGPIVISGCVGPRGDGYEPGQIMSIAEAEAYHTHQIRAFADAQVDMTTAITITNTPEAIGIAQAAATAGLPVAIAFTLETTGQLPTGQSLGGAIDEVEQATGSAPSYYMINCAHPDHFTDILVPGEAWTERIRGVRANASRRSHEELNDSPDLDAGDPVELAEQYSELLRRHPQLTILGGCCGTDHRHIHSISHACRSLHRA